MKLPKGPLKVITFADLDTLTENERRARASGKIFHPTVRVAVKGKGDNVRVVTGFGLRFLSPPAGDVAEEAEVKSSITTFPHLWAVPNRAYVRQWIETTEAVEVVTSLD